MRPSESASTWGTRLETHRSIKLKLEYTPEMCITLDCSGSEAGLYLRFIDTCITQLQAEGPSRTCNESKEEEEEMHPSESDPI